MKRFMRRSLGIGVTVWVGLLMAVVIAAQPPGAAACGEMVRLALQTAGDACEGMGRNQVCYGHVLGDVTPQAEAAAIEWDSVGDTADLTAISALDLSPLNTEADQWGVAVMQVQASLPDTLPGQNVTMLLFGDVEIQDAAIDQARVDATTLGAANIRLSPSTDGLVIGSLPVNTPLVVTGQTLNRAGETWLRVKYEDYRTRTGWTFANLVDVDLALLPEVASDSLVYNPMQAFYFKTGLGSTQCAEVPTDGVMIQTPKGMGLINLNVNGVHVSLGSTAFLTTTRASDAAPDSPEILQVTLFEGQGVIESQGVTRVLVPGSQTEIELDEQGQAASIPSRPEPYVAEEFDFYDQQLADQGVELPEPAADYEIEDENPVEEAEDAVFSLPVCEDPDEDGVCDTCRDRNENGVCDGLECIDIDGNGSCRGCRDENENGVCDYQECLDSDDDGVCDQLCYDLNQNDICDGQENECQDRNANGVCDRDECLDLDEDGTCDVACIDSDGNNLCDKDECRDDPSLPICTFQCNDDDGDGICNSQDDCTDADGDGACDNCVDADANGVCDEDGSSCQDVDADDICDDIDPAICMPGDERPVCGCLDRNGDGICDYEQCVDKDGNGTCDCPDLNQNGRCDGQENTSMGVFFVMAQRSVPPTQAPPSRH